MKVLLPVLILLPIAARAEVIQCPERFPSEQTQLSNKSIREGSARILPSRLSGAFMVSGELYAEQQFVPEIKKVPGGRDVLYNFPGEGRWLVCGYGGNVEWWIPLKPQITECELRIREAKTKQPESRMSATATCK